VAVREPEAFGGEAEAFGGEPDGTVLDGASWTGVGSGAVRASVSWQAASAITPATTVASRTPTRLPIPDLPGRPP
jgi:hypothetical protein